MPKSLARTLVNPLLIVLAVGLVIVMPLGFMWIGLRAKAAQEGIEPYVMYAIGLGLVAFFMTMGMGFTLVEDPQAVLAPEVTDGRWTRLSPQRTLRARVITNVVQGAMLLAMTAWGAWHFHGRGVRDTWAGILAAVGFAWAGLFFVLAVRAYLTRRVVGDALILVEADDLRPGRTARVRVRQEFGAGVKVEELKVGLVCTVVSGHGKSRQTRTVSEHWEATPVPPTTPGRASRKLLNFDTAFTVGPGQIPTRHDGGRSYTWKFVVTTRIGGWPDYKQEFGVTVLEKEEA